VIVVSLLPITVGRLKATFTTICRENHMSSRERIRVAAAIRRLAVLAGRPLCSYECGMVEEMILDGYSLHDCVVELWSDHAMVSTLAGRDRA
jgi:hypothetical protein